MIDDGSVSIQMVPTWGPSSTAKLTVLEGKFNICFLRFISFPLVSTFYQLKRLSWLDGKLKASKYQKQNENFEICF